MASLATFVALSIFTLGFFHVEGAQDTLTAEDASFCRGGLEVIYPKLDVRECLIVPKERKLREKLSTAWKAPQVYYSEAKEKKTYVLTMVDPDAPKRSSSTSVYWRHWLVVNIQGRALWSGFIQGTTLTDYHPPTPPQTSGLHRYQFMLFEQPPNTQVSLTHKESSRGKWDLQAFITRSGLGKPVATVQFLTQNYND
ncbi:phosphatidylethanolamine-binding protein 4 [Salarias fasciatus]|uniref:phosphatidylethanolamine-binding protein 4 n=1 Tax=Salarias fasciatus TaxID=181472 RepID=UPI001176C979|nr:phosphatidylethanolamine-binding protein 4 [Salarias fasciatus]